MSWMIRYSEYSFTGIFEGEGKKYDVNAVKSSFLLSNLMGFWNDLNMKTERCWNCKKFEEHFYWDHLEETNIRFMKVMEGNFSHEMEFPRKFARNFRVDLPDLITLEASDGDLWKIILFKEEDHFYLKDGWKEFIDAYGIKEGCSLFFKYAGNSSFTVKVFDQNGCLRDTSNFTRYNKNKAKKICQTRKKVDEAARNLKRSQSSTFEICSFSKLVCDDYKLVHEISGSKFSGKSFSDEVVSCKRKLREIPEVQEVKPPKIWQGLNQNHIKLNGRLRSETKEMMEISEGILKKLQPSYVYQTGDSSFVKVMMKSHLCGQPFMVIPSGFVSDHFHIKPKRIILCKAKEKQWIVSCRFRNSSFGFVGKSFHDFVHDNNLKEGDLCVFKFISSSTAVMDVRIVSAVEANSIKKSCLFYQ